MTEFSAWKIWDIPRDDPGKGVKLGGEVHPDLVRFKGHWYCGFKESGRSRIIRSIDGETWETVKLIDWDGIAIGRPYLSITPHGTLMINSWARPLGPSAAERVKHGKSLIPGQYSVTWLTEDGVNWSEVYASPITLGYSTTWFDGVGYHFSHRDGTLYYTLDGKRWDVMAEAQYPEGEELPSYDPHDLANKPGTVKSRGNEAALAFDPNDGTGYVLLRTNPIGAMIGVAHPPHYDDWTWQDAQVDWEGDGNLVPAHEVMGVQLGGPVLKYLSDGRLIGAGRADNSTPDHPRARVVLFFVDPQRAVLTPFAKLDGYGHYCGVVEHEGELWVACGNESQREAFEVYMLRLKVPAMETAAAT